MASGRGLIRGFLVGVFLTVLVAAGVGYFAYLQLQRKISPEGIQSMAQSTLTRVVGQSVEVGSAELTGLNAISLSGLKLGEGETPFLSIDRVEAVAEEGAAGLRQGRISQITLENPVLALERRGGVWNLASYLEPFLAGAFSPEATGEAVADATGSAGPAGLPLTLVKVKNLKLTVSLDEGPDYSGIEVGDLALARESPTDPWRVVGERASVRLNPMADEWPLFEIAGLFPEMTGRIDPAAADTTDESTVAKWLGEVTLNGLRLEVVHENQRYEMEGISVSTDALLSLIEARTGGLKKNSGPLNRRKPGPRDV